METTTCLFSRARPGKSATPKKVRGFMSLPGEIRNQIYEYYFEAGFRCEIVAKEWELTGRKPKTVKLWSGVLPLDTKIFKSDSNVEEARPATIRMSRLLGRYTIVKGLQTNWSTSICALSLVCKQMYAEIVTLMYQRTEFVFDAPKRVGNFVRRISQPNLANIRKLQLHYTTYGNPWQDFDHMQSRHIESWRRCCKLATKNLTGLKDLTIWINVTYITLFNLRQAWLLPILQFRRLARNFKTTNAMSTSEPRQQYGLDVVQIDFRTYQLDARMFTFREPELMKASNDLHRLFGQAISLAIRGESEKEAMEGFSRAWTGKYERWQHHLGYASTGW